MSPGNGSSPKSGGAASPTDRADKQRGQDKSSNGPVSGGKATPMEAKPQSSTDDGGGSSPLGPILIAIVILAAISLGAVLYRRRRGSDRSSPSVSPEAS